MSVAKTPLAPNQAAACVSTPTPAPNTTTCRSCRALAACRYSSCAARTDPGHDTNPNGSKREVDDDEEDDDDAEFTRPKRCVVVWASQYAVTS